MYFKIACPHCGKNLKARDEHIGRKVGCPYCKRTVSIVAPPVPTDQVEPERNELGGLKTSVTAGRRQRPSQRAGERAAASNVLAGGADVSMPLSALLGLVLSILFYLAVLPFAKIYLGQLFLNRGWVPFVLVFLSCWSASILLLKWRKLSRQRASMLFDVLPSELAEEIDVAAASRFAQHISALPVEPGASFLITRVLRGLQHFQIRKSTAEVADMLASQSEIDASSVQSSYTLLKYFIWAIPILGFIGTVIGISSAVGGFSGALDKADDISVLKESLNGVTSGLATAFDTTLVALVMSMLVKFPTSAMQKAEEGLIVWVDEYCNENLLKRLNDGREGGAERGSGMTNRVIRQSVEAAMVPHHAELQTWLKKLESIGGQLSNQVVEGWDHVNERLQSQHEQKMTEVQELDRMSGAFHERLAELAEQAESMQDQLSGAANHSAQTLQTAMADLSRGLTGLNDVLERLGEKQVVIQTAPRRRGWFFRRGNGAK